MKRAALIVLDGWGVAPPDEGNAAHLARTPNLDRLMETYPTVLLDAFGPAVGLPWQEMGNSEVGHLTLGTGRIVYQDLVRINRAIDSGSFFQNEALQEAVGHARRNTSALHIIGCASEGGIHAHIAHMEAALELAKREQLNHVYVHVILDGRDVPKSSGVEYVKRLQKKMKQLNVGQMATLVGRFYAMDRDNRWDRIATAYRAMAYGEGQPIADPVKALKQSYSDGVYDEQVPPLVVTRKGQPVTRVQEGDAVVFCNFRSDRAKQLTKAFVLPGIDEKAGRDALLRNVVFVTMTQYDRKTLPVRIAFPSPHLPNTVGEVIADHGLKQFRVAETEKYAHITVFFSAGRIDPYEGEDRQLIPSPAVSAYEEVPEMSAYGVKDALLAAMRNTQYSFYLANFANPDMIGHTADIPAALKAMEVVDECVGSIVQAGAEEDILLIFTADHGNIEVMRNMVSGDIDKGHTSNPVPCMLVHPDLRGKGATSRDLLWQQSSSGVLTDVGPTILSYLGLSIPDEMTGQNILATLSSHS